MNAKDFRIGNLITRQDLGTGEPRIETILELRKDKVFTSGPVTVICNYEDINPIPLTDEWLINLGYDADCDISENPMHFRKDGHLIWKPAGIFYDDLYRIELKYVHQLQNLYFAIKQQELICKN